MYNCGPSYQTQPGQQPASVQAPGKGYMRDDETSLQDDPASSDDEVENENGIENGKKKKSKLLGIFIFNDDREN